MSFELFAKKESILRDISEEAQNFLLKDYEVSHAGDHQDENGCPLISIPVFTDQLRIHYAVYSNRSEKNYSTSGHAASIIEFHRVFTCHESEGRLNYKKDLLFFYHFECL